MSVIPAIHHLEILALRERLNSGLMQWQACLQTPTSEELKAIQAVLREGFKSIRAGREFMLALLLGWLMSLRDSDAEAGIARSQNHRQLESRVSKRCHSDAKTFGANYALRFSKSCVLWSRYLS